MITVTDSSPQQINTSLFALEQEIKKLYKDLDSISERLVGIEGSDTVVPPEQVNSDWNATNGKAEILNKPDLSVYATKSDIGEKAPVDQVILKETPGSQTIKSSSGGTDTPLILDTTHNNGGCYIGFKNKASLIGYLGVSGNKKPSFWDTESHDIMLNEDLYYEDYRFDNPTWSVCGNVYYAGSLKTWTGDIRSKIISAQVVYWSGFYPWAIFDHASTGSTKTTLALFSATNTQGYCIVRVWYKR